LSKSNWFESEYFSGILTINSTAYIPPIFCDVLIDCCEYVHWTERRTYGHGKHWHTKIVHFQDAAITLSKRFTIMQSADGFGSGQY